MKYKTIECLKAGNVMTIRLNRSDKHNAINELMGAELVECFDTCEDEKDIKTIILTGNGKNFCSGGELDTKEFASTSPRLIVKRLLNAVLPALLEIKQLSKPVIAAVNGAAVGGGFSLAMFCDLIIAAESATFKAQWIINGMSPDGGISYMLPRIIGEKRAAWMMYTGDKIDAQKAYELGIVNQVVADNDLISAANSLAERLAGSASLAISNIKKLTNRAWNGNLENQLEYEKKLVADLALSEDLQEAVAAFLEKRKPKFKGR